jgi:mono/diheme cytochrome c family protein
MSTSSTLALALALAACDWDFNRMNDQPRCEPGDRRPWLPDQRCDQSTPTGTIPWHAPPATSDAPAPSRASIMRGADRFARICAPCHGTIGDGNSVIANDMVLRRPPSLLIPPAVTYTDQRIFETITSGYGLMPGYAYQLSPSDRWSIVQFLRVLERSQRFPLAELSPAEHEEARRWLQ